MSRTLITVKDNSLIVTIKNLCSFSYNTITDDFIFTSASFNIHSLANFYFKFKSFGFSEYVEYNFDPFTPHPLAKHLIVHKSLHNEYSINFGMKNHKYEHYINVCVPSKVFKKLRYAVYDLQDCTSIYPVLIRGLGYKYKLSFQDLDSNDLKLKLFKINKSTHSVSNVKRYICFEHYTQLILDNGEEYVLSPNFKKARVYGNKYFLNYGDLTSKFDLFEYLLNKQKSDV